MSENYHIKLKAQIMWILWKYHFTAHLWKARELAGIEVELGFN